MSGGSGSGDSSSVIQGGGPGITNMTSPGKKPGETDQQKIDLKKSQAELERQEGLRLGELKARLEAAIEANKTLRQFRKQLLIDITTEGLRIQIVDEQNRPMFAMSKAQLQPYTKEILREIGRVLNDVPNKISLSGHTDATPYASGERSYSNWELSADRANASRRELIAGGMEDTKILRVVGLSSAVLMDRDNPFSPINRRISIIVMNKKAEESVSKDGGTINVSQNMDVKAELNEGK
ncbi:MAG: flagellar motor protein MotB, partial [Burkholderiaceae bacterium]|nr:flagellar motor protein MotB [Burkholderiaceae bacterium]